MADASPARRLAVSIPEAAQLFGTVTERLAIRADRGVSTPIEQQSPGDTSDTVYLDTAVIQQ
eukprot:2970844-Prymnesium_polylepis.1